MDLSRLLPLQQTLLALSAHPQLHSWQACCSSANCRNQATSMTVGRAGYSTWTGYSFKAPLLANAVACLVGNVAYSLSYDLNSWQACCSSANCRK